MGKIWGNSSRPGLWKKRGAMVTCILTCAAESNMALEDVKTVKLCGFVRKILCSTSGSWQLSIQSLKKHFYMAVVTKL